MLKPKINVFYELKAHYKLLRIYAYINKKVPESDFKNKALSCCGNFKYPYKCFNFSKKKVNQIMVYLDLKNMVLLKNLDVKERH